MSTAPLTLVSGNAAIVLSGQAATAPSGLEYNYWMVVLDRTTSTPDIVASEVANASTVPSGIAPYSGDSNKILVVVNSSVGAFNYPQGDLNSFLLENGASDGLIAAEQIAEDAGSAAGGYFNYVLVAVMDGNPGHEAFSFQDNVAMAIELQQIAGLWTPLQPNTAL